MYQWHKNITIIHSKGSFKNSQFGPRWRETRVTTKRKELLSAGAEDPVSQIGDTGLDAVIHN